MKQMTVQALLDHLQEMVKTRPSCKNKYIVVADDNEGNSYHGLFYGLTVAPSDVKNIIEFSNGLSDSITDDTRDLVILG